MPVVFILLTTAHESFLSFRQLGTLAERMETPNAWVGTDAILLFASLFRARFVVHPAVVDPTTRVMVYQGASAEYGLSWGGQDVTTLHIAMIDGLHWRPIVSGDMVSACPLPLPPTSHHFMPALRTLYHPVGAHSPAAHGPHQCRGLCPQRGAFQRRARRFRAVRSSPGRAVVRGAGHERRERLQPRRRPPRRSPTRQLGRGRKASQPGAYRRGRPGRLQGVSNLLTLRLYLFLYFIFFCTHQGNRARQGAGEGTPPFDAGSLILM